MGFCSYLSSYLPSYLQNYLPSYLPSYLSVCLSVCLCLSICLTSYICTFSFLCIFLSTSLSIYIYILLGIQFFYSEIGRAEEYIICLSRYALCCSQSKSVILGYCLVWSDLLSDKLSSDVVRLILTPPVCTETFN